MNQFAYNEMSFLIIRLLQSFKSFHLDLSSAPPEAHPPADWAGQPGRQSVEKIFPKMHLTMYTNVSTSFVLNHLNLTSFESGRALD